MRQDAMEPTGTFPVKVVAASFPPQQHLAQATRMRIEVQNAGRRTIPNIAVTVEAKGKGTSARAFAEPENRPDLADPSRPVWIVDQGPPNGTTAYTNTWAQGPLYPGQSSVFVWKVTAVKPGRHSIVYEIAAGLNGKAVACLASSCGSTKDRVKGSFVVTIAQTPRNDKVGPNGQILGGAPPPPPQPPPNGENARP